MHSPAPDSSLPPGWVLSQEWEVTPAKAAEALARNETDELFVLDCRTPAEHAVASIAGTTLIPLQDLPHRLAELESHRHKRIITVCHHGKRSLVAARFLRANGFPDVHSMAGGIDAWSISIDQSVPRYEA